MSNTELIDKAINMASEARDEWKYSNHKEKAFKMLMDAKNILVQQDSIEAKEQLLFIYPTLHELRKEMRHSPKIVLKHLTNAYTISHEFPEHKDHQAWICTWIAWDYYNIKNSCMARQWYEEARDTFSFLGKKEEAEKVTYMLNKLSI